MQHAKVQYEFEPKDWVKEASDRNGMNIVMRQWLKRYCV